MNTFLSVGEVAGLLRKSDKWVYENKAHIPGYFRLARSIFFDREILTTELKKRALKSTKTKG